MQNLSFDLLSLDSCRYVPQERMPNGESVNASALRRIQAICARLLADWFSDFAGFLSLMLLVGFVSNYITLARLPTRPTATWQWVGINAMTIVVLTASTALALVSSGLMRSKSSTWKRGLWILLGSVLAYAVIAATVVII